MYAAEAAFLRAEGALKGWNMGGDAKTFYEKGVRLSFEEFGVSGADDYLADATSIPGNYVDNLIAGHTGNNYTNQSSLRSSGRMELMTRRNWKEYLPRNGLPVIPTR